MNNRFIILVGSRNNSQWVESNISSIINQDYSNYITIYFDDASEDNTYKKAKEIINNNSNFILRSTLERKYKTWFFSNIREISGVDIQDNDIIVFLDGDDTLASDNVLSYLNEVYAQSQCWMTYGGMLVWDGNTVSEPYPQNSEIPENIRNNKLYRKDTWRTSHLKSMRGFIWKLFDKKDLCPNGTYMVGPDDLAIMFSALELCPPKKVYRVTDPIYIYNHSNENNNSRAFTDSKNTNYEEIVRNRIPYDTLSFVTPTLAGGLGNQLFEISAAASLAKDNNAVLILDNTKHILPNQGKNVNTYINNIFNKIMIDSNISAKNVYKRDVCTYEAIPYSNDLQLMGHFQSWKYFDHNRQYIQQLFSPTSEIQALLPEIPDDHVAIQIRRGDYIKFPNHHPLLPKEYFYEAIKLINPSKITIFSDDINWCKENLDFNINCDYNIEMSDVMELYTMTKYKNLIISNSSFGWWAAYLNTTPDKKIYCPSTWFGSAMINEGFNIKELIFSDWITI